VHEASPFISVVLPVHNGEQYLRESIDSVLLQAYPNFEFIIWDDHATDSSAQIIDSYQDSRIRRFANERNLGLFKTLNRAIAEAKGDWIRLWSQDDQMKPNCLAEESDFIRHHPTVGMIYCAVDLIDQNGDIIMLSPRFATPDVVSPELAAQIMFFHGSIAGNIANVTLKKSVLDEVGPFREDMWISGDFEMWVRLSEKYPLGFLEKSLIKLRAHKGQFSRAKGSYTTSIGEDQFIYAALMNRLPPELSNYSRKYHRWHRGPMYWHHMVRCFLARDFDNAFKSYRTIKELSVSRFFLAWFWLLTINQRLYRLKPKYAGTCAAYSDY